MKHRIIFGLITLVLLSGCVGSFGGNDQTEVETPASTSISTGEILLQTSQLPNGYVLDGKTIKNRSTVENKTAEQFSERGILKQHERVYFQLDSDSNGPNLVLVSATVFESNDQATDYTESFIDSLESDGTPERITFGEGKSAQSIQFTNDQGLKNVVLISRIDNLVLYITSSDPEQYYTEQTRDLFIAMYSNAE